MCRNNGLTWRQLSAALSRIPPDKMDEPALSYNCCTGKSGPIHDLVIDWLSDLGLSVNDPCPVIRHD